MQRKIKCKCGSTRIVYVVQKGKGQSQKAFCEKCLPVEASDEQRAPDERKYTDSN